MNLKSLKCQKLLEVGGALGGHAEDEDVVLADPFADLDVRAVEGAEGDRAVLYLQTGTALIPKLTQEISLIQT